MYHKYQKTLLFTLLSVFILSLQAVAQNDPLYFLSDTTEYAWPTDATQYLSSTFGETRSAHLHAGIDIRTWGQEGYRVFAARDGVVYRIGIGPHGYGHVIYLKHSDESFTVYAHLNRFEPELQSFADSIRLRDFTYELDLTIEDENIKFEKGDVIGYTGSTGVGPPHLHFEIRDPNFNPVNPLLTNLSRFISDDLPPIFSQLGIEYLDTDGFRYRGFDLLQATKTDGRYDFGEIDIDGPVGLSVNVHDKANRTPNSYAVYSLMMVHESDTLFHSVKDSFSFHHSGDMFLDRSYQILSQTRRGFQRLYRVHGNRLPIYRRAINEGVLHFEDGSYPIKIFAEDIYGNQSVASLVINVNRTDELSLTNPINYVATYPAPDILSNRPVYNWLETTVVPEESLLASAGPELVNPDFRNIRFYYTNRRSVEKSLKPNSVEFLHTPDQKLWIRFPSKSLYDTLTVRMEVIQAADQIDIELSPTKLPISRSAQFNYILPDEFKDRSQLGIFSVDPHRNRENFISANISSGIARATLSEITNLRIREDRIAPWVGRPEIIQNLAGMHVVRVPAKDGDTGIDYRRSTIVVNGDPGIVEYDPEKDHLLYYNPDFEPKATNTVEYSVYDGVGNQTSRTVDVRFSR